MCIKRKMPKIKVHEREEAPVSIGNDDQHFAISSSRLPATWAIHPNINSKKNHQHTTANQIQMYTSLCWSASCMRNIPSRNILFFYSQGYHLFMSSKDTFQTSIMGWSTCIQDWNYMQVKKKWSITMLPQKNYMKGPTNNSAGTKHQLSFFFFTTSIKGNYMELFMPSTTKDRAKVCS